MSGEIMIRPATYADGLEMREIYAPYVEKTAVSFEYEVPPLEVFLWRMKQTILKYPYLAAEQDGELLGYACTHPFVGRAAYDWSAEVTIYVREDQRHRGIGRKLYEALEDISRKQHIFNLNACIGYPETDDEFLTKDSVKFHERMGYRMAGRFHNSGYKFGRWYDMVWMEKILGEHPEKPEPVIPFSKLNRK